MEREHEFESVAATYLRTYLQQPDAVQATRKSEAIAAYVRHTDATAQRRATISDEYLTEMDQAPPKVAMAARDECPRACRARSCCSAPQSPSCRARRCGYAVTYL